MRVTHCLPDRDRASTCGASATLSCSKFGLKPGGAPFVSREPTFLVCVSSRATSPFDALSLDRTNPKPGPLSRSVGFSTGTYKQATMNIGKATVAALIVSSATCASAFVATNSKSVFASLSTPSRTGNNFAPSPSLVVLRSTTEENEQEEEVANVPINGIDGDSIADESSSSTIDESSSDEEATSTVSISDAANAVVDMVSEAATAPERTTLLNNLLRTASSCGRGEFATPDEKAAISDIIAELEALSPTDDPTTSSSIEGTWELLYSDTQLFRSSPFFMAGRAVCSTPEEAEQYDWFCDMHRAALAISNIGKVRQIVSSDRMVSEFEVKVGSIPFLSDFTPFSYSGGLPITIDGAIVSSADITPTDEGRAWEIFMDTVEIKGSNIPLLRQVLDGGLKLGSRDLGSFLEDNVSGYTNPKPVFETTYLDDSVRISRDQDGKVFVYGKVSDSTEPTEYDGVMPDLGVGKLLEGLNDSFFKFYL